MKPILFIFLWFIAMAARAETHVHHQLLTHYFKAYRDNIPDLVLEDGRIASFVDGYELIGDSPLTSRSIRIADKSGRKTWMRLTYWMDRDVRVILQSCQSKDDCSQDDPRERKVVDEPVGEPTVTIDGDGNVWKKQAVRTWGTFKKNGNSEVGTCLIDRHMMVAIFQSTFQTCFTNAEVMSLWKPELGLKKEKQ